MRVVAEEAFRFFYNHVPIDVAEGEAIDSDAAAFLLNRRSASVRPDDEDAEALLAQLREDGGQEQETEPPPPPPGSSPTGLGNQQDPGSGQTAPPPGGELDIDASVKDVLAWVGEDAERADEAKRLEEAKDKPRSTLVKELAKIADPGE